MKKSNLLHVFSMREPVEYPNPPITEAIIDLRVQPREDFTLEDLSHLPDGAQYPIKETIVHRESVTKFQADLEPEIQAVQIPIGYKYKSINNQYVVQLQQQGFTLSHLPPYEGWTCFQRKARELWGAYREAVRPVSVKRMAVRYINRINIPGENVDLKEYFRTSPEISPDLPQMMAGFVMQVLLPLPKILAVSRINQTIMMPEQDHSSSILLDIDVFRTEALPHDEDEIWSLFEILREQKNKIFDACITEKTKELFS